MPSTTTYRRGDVVLVPFPYTDLTNSKKRPALVVSGASYGPADIIVAQITGNVTVHRFGDHAVTGWRQAGLLIPSIVRAKLATLDRAMVQRKLGRMPANDMTLIDSELRLALSL